jgi:hypothetical protein
MERIAADLWRWTGRHPEWHPGAFGAEVACFALRAGDTTILIDPLVVGDEQAILARLDGIVAGRVEILITIPYHARSAEMLWRRYRSDHETTIRGHRLVTKRLADTSGFRELSPGAELPGGVRAHAIGKPRRSEMPLELPSHRALAFGDAVVEVAGRLRVWELPAETERRREWYEDRFLPTLRPLAALDVDRVLVTHGEPIMSGGAAAVAAALEAPPWHRKLGLTG